MLFGFLLFCFWCGLFILLFVLFGFVFVFCILLVSFIVFLKFSLGFAAFFRFSGVPIPFFGWLSWRFVLVTLPKSLLRVLVQIFLGFFSKFSLLHLFAHIAPVSLVLNLVALFVRTIFGSYSVYVRGFFLCHLLFLRIVTVSVEEVFF